MTNRVTRTHRRDGIQFGANGYLSLADNEIDVSSGDLTLDIAGALALDSTNASNAAGDGTLFKTAGTPIGAITSHHSLTTLTLYEAAGASTDDYFTISVGASGATTISTIDAAGAGANLSFEPDGGIKLSPTSAAVIMQATHRLFFDGGTDTYIHERAPDNVEIVVGDVALLTFLENGGGANDRVWLQQATGLYFDGGGDTYIANTDTDVLSIIAGDNTIVTFSESGNAGNLVNMGTSGAGFTQHEPTYNATDTEVYFSRLGNKAFLTFGSGNIADLNLHFPNVSCNCVLVLKQDGTGSRTVAADGWLAHDSAGNAANGSSIVYWPGGTEPTLTTAANAIDIISFYWDNDNEIAYGVISQDFK